MEFTMSKFQGFFNSWRNNPGEHSLIFSAINDDIFMDLTVTNNPSVVFSYAPDRIAILGDNLKVAINGVKKIVNLYDAYIDGELMWDFKIYTYDEDNTYEIYLKKF